MRRVEFSPIVKCLSIALSEVDVDFQWTPDKFCTAAVDEAWNTDELSEEGIIALKHLFFRLMIPREHWNDITYDKFLKIVQTKYKERLETEI